jgi:molybdopterin synthase sulfur carrier subunit
MTITIKYFGLLVDLTHKNEEELIFGENKMSVAYLKAKLEIFYSNLNQVPFTIAVNQKKVDLDYLIQHQDIVAFLPPFAGG